MPLSSSSDPTSTAPVLNDIQSQLNRTRLHRIVKVDSLDSIISTLSEATQAGLDVSIAGGRHSMGGQQLGENTIHLDTTPFNRVLNFDPARGLITVESGIMWPALIEWLEREQSGRPQTWGPRQKQTGVDDVTIGGSLSSNVHGRGLRFPPLVSDIESFDLVIATGELRHCSRSENPDLFSLAIGGYGLFGVFATVTLRLAPRLKLERVVKVIPVREFPEAIDERIAAGFLYGDIQFSPCMDSDPDDHPGVFSCYRPVSPDTPMPETQLSLNKADWTEFYMLTRTNKARAFQLYSQYYLSTSGQLYWSDSSQLAGSLDYYHDALKLLTPEQQGTEMITEVYVPPEAYHEFLRAARRDFLEFGLDPTYGTIRLIEPDIETFLPWARARYVCVVCNLHVTHTPQGIEKAAHDFRRIIDRAIEFNGSFYLTYHRYATRQQIETCYPKFKDFLNQKIHHDPQALFQSTWYRHYRAMFADQL